MCGIAGFSGNFNESLLKRMADAIAHRGPDDCGEMFLPERKIGLCHRRLSIIDLSPTGHQPLSDTNNRAVIVYNGELYNYKELKGKLEKSGFTFKGNSDTEVILAMYIKHGKDMFKHLNGIFAFAIFDKIENTLLLARDHLGVKPLYYSAVNDGVIFSSEMKSLLSCDSIKKEININAVVNHLRYLNCPAPETMLKGVKKLNAGTALTIKEGKIIDSFSFYKLPEYNPDFTSSEDDLVKQTRKHVEASVMRQMVSDVKVGAFLSGGLDSSAIAAFAKNASKEKLECFTIKFKDSSSGWEGFAEDLPYAQKVAKHLDVNLNTIEVGPEFITEIPKMVWHLDEPLADPAAVNSLFICKLAHKQGIKVLLSGTGGDDVFTGYRRHYALHTERYWRWLPQFAKRGISSTFGTLNSSSNMMRRLNKAFRHSHLSENQRIAGHFYWTENNAIHNLLNVENFNNVTPSDIECKLHSILSGIDKKTNAIEKMLILEKMFFLAEHNLLYGDKMSMATGVEVRVPLIDIELVEFASKIPTNLKQRGSCGKYIFKKAMEGYLPHDVIYRPKTGFGIPLRQWLHNQLKDFTNEMLSESSINKRGLFNAESVQQLLTNNKAGKIDATYTLFSLMCIEMWCRKFIDGE